MDFELSAKDLVDMAFAKLCTVISDKEKYLKYRNMLMLYHNVCIDFDKLLDIYLQDVCIKTIIESDYEFITRLTYGDNNLIIDTIINELWYANIELIKIMFYKYPNKRKCIFNQALKNKNTNLDILDMLYLPKMYTDINVVDFLVACSLNKYVLEHVKKVENELYLELFQVNNFYDLQIKL